MPAVLRCHHKPESNSERPERTFKGSNRRTRRGRRTEEENDYSDGGISDGEAGSYNQFNNNGRPFDIVAGLPCSLEVPQYNSVLTHPLSVRDSAVLYDSLVISRRTWIRGEMFELYFSKPARSTKDESNTNKQDAMSQAMTMQIRDKMQKMCDCFMTGGPHLFPVRLFILKNEELEKRWQDEQDFRRRERDEKRKKDQEEKKRRVEEKRQSQLLRKQEKENLVRLQKENKARAKQELEAMKLKRKEEIKKAKEDHKKKYRKSGNSSAPGPTIASSGKVSPPPNNQSVNDPKMIANLNLMAQKDSKLNVLMGTVANGEASLEQVEEFRKFIEVARKMPPPPGWCSPPASVQLKKESAESRRETRKEQDIKEEKMDNAIKVVVKEDEKKVKVKRGDDENMLGTKTVRSNSMKNEDVDNDLDSSEPPKNKEGKRRRRPRGSVKEEEDKSLQLTAFQQKYVKDAQIILEFSEYTHARYMVPRHAIMDYDDESNDYKVSWILVHNKQEIDKYRNRRIKEMVKGKKTDEEKRAVKEEYNVFDDEMCPSPLFTPMTVVFSGIHKKFKPILANSVEPIEKVQKEMSNILNIGTKLSGYNLWYQLDGCDDQDLAESIRVDLTEHEYDLRGKRQKK